MKLFTVGPVEMYQRTLDLGANNIPYFRTTEFSALMQDTDQLLKRIVKTENSSQVVYLTASGTAAMEATVMNCFTENDKLLIISGGTFGKRFEQICKIHNYFYDVIELQLGEAFSKEKLQCYENKGYTGLLVNLHETSTGQLYDISIIRDFCKRNQMYLIVDAISTFLCDPYEMDDFGIDVTIMSSQKGLCLPPGLSMVVLNEKIVNERVNKINPKSLYFDFKDYISNMERGQTPFTPAIGILVQLNDILHFIHEIGLDEYLAEIKARCEYFRSQIKALPIDIPTYPLSNAITPIIFRQDIATVVFEKLKNEYDIVVNPTGGVLKNKVVRISHIGNIKKEDMDILIKLIKSFV